jgi:hypothetical protein
MYDKWHEAFTDRKNGNIFVPTSQNVQNKYIQLKICYLLSVGNIFRLLLWGKIATLSSETTKFEILIRNVYCRDTMTDTWVHLFFPEWKLVCGKFNWRLIVEEQTFWKVFDWLFLAYIFNQVARVFFSAP